MNKFYYDRIAKQVAETFKFNNVIRGTVDSTYIENHCRKWDELSKVSRSAILLFDFFLEKFVYVSNSGFEPFGIAPNDFIEKGHNLIAEKLHPEDMEYMLNIRRQIYLHLNALKTEDKKNYKAIHRMRLRNLDNNYICITEHEQIVELDSNGNIWLTLSIIDIDANENKEDFKSYLYNCHTGNLINFSASNILEESLTSREIEILKMMKDGYLSKEISEKLFISINTVNTHRQNIFRKLKADNSIEAINTAKKTGLI